MVSIFPTVHRKPIVRTSPNTKAPPVTGRITSHVSYTQAQHILSLFSLNPWSKSETNPTPPPSTAQPDLPPSLAAELASLRARVCDILSVFDDPRYAPLDVPDWVRRAWPLAHHTRIKGEALARHLQRLASAWVAFLLWPCYARMRDPSCLRGYASPCTGLSHARKAMAFGAFDSDECIPMSSYPLRDQVLGRDGHRCVVSGVWDNRCRTGARAPYDAKLSYVDAARIFKHPLVVYKDVYDNDKAKRESVLLSLEVLRRFCQLDDRHIAIEPPDSGGVMDDPANLLSLCCNAHLKFDMFALSFVPTQCANTYKITDHDPPLLSVPIPYERSLTPRRTVTFRDLSTTADRGPEHHAVPLPDSALLRMHAALGSVLYATGAARMFDRIEETVDLDHERPDVQDLPVPDPDGVAFWRDVVVGPRGAGVDPDASLDLEGFARVLGVPARA